MWIAFHPRSAYPRIEAVGISLVPAERVPAGSSLGRSPAGPALRIDFRSRSPLEPLRLTQYLQVRFCDDKENQWWEIWSGYLYVGDERLSETSPGSDSGIIYSGYFPIAHTPAIPPGLDEPIPAINDRAYDLRNGARPLCVWIDYGTGAFNVARTYEIRFEAQQVAAALRALR
jgi:hypothetical protein